MGYGFRVREEGFRLASEYRKDALAAIKAESARERLSWTEPPVIAACKRFDAAVIELGWACDFDEDDNVTGLSFEREKIGDEGRWMAAIAPFVDAGSRIDCVGEDGEHWRWLFDGRRLHTLSGRVSFDAPDPTQASG